MGLITPLYHATCMKDFEAQCRNTAGHTSLHQPLGCLGHVTDMIPGVRGRRATGGWTIFSDWVN